MHILIAVLGAIAAIYFFVARARNTADMAGEILDAANDVRLAARRFGFRKQANQHPAEAIEDPNIALAGLGCAMLELDGLPRAEQQRALHSGLAKASGLTLTAAEELAVLGRWMMMECGGAETAVPRLSRKLYKMQGAEGFQSLMQLLQTIAQSGSEGLNRRQKEALSDIQRAFRIS